MLSGNEEQECASQQHNVFGERLAVGQCDGIAEATAVGYGTIEVNIDRHRRHDEHEQESADCGQTFAHAQQQVNAEGELNQRKGNGSRIEVERTGRNVPAHVIAIRLEFMFHAHRVKCFHEAREEKRRRQQPLCQGGRHAQDNAQCLILSHESVLS